MTPSLPVDSVLLAQLALFALYWFWLLIVFGLRLLPAPDVPLLESFWFWFWTVSLFSLPGNFNCHCLWLPAFDLGLYKRFLRITSWSAFGSLYHKNLFSFSALFCFLLLFYLETFLLFHCSAAFFCKEFVIVIEFRRTVPDLGTKSIGSFVKGAELLGVRNPNSLKELWRRLGESLFCRTKGDVSVQFTTSVF